MTVVRASLFQAMIVQYANVTVSDTLVNECQYCIIDFAYKDTLPGNHATLSQNAGRAVNAKT